MAFNIGNSSEARAEINVTPLIDVLLVLLIIFMILVPMTPRGLAALLPQPPKDHVAAVPEPPVVVQLDAGAGGAILYRLNQQPFTKLALANELNRVMAGRQEKVLFVKGARDLEFSSIADVVALGREANAERIGILTPGVEAGR